MQGDVPYPAYDSYVLRVNKNSNQNQRGSKQAPVVNNASADQLNAALKDGGFFKNDFIRLLKSQEMTIQIIEISVLNNKTLSSLKSIVDSERNSRRTVFALGMQLTT